MGNCYKGYLSLVLKKNTPDYILDILLDLQRFNYKEEDYEKRIVRLSKRREMFFSCSKFSYLNIEVIPQLKRFYDNKKDVPSLGLYCSYVKVMQDYKQQGTFELLSTGSWKSQAEMLYYSGVYNYQTLNITTANKALKCRLFDSLIVNVSCNIKGYSKELETFIDFLKPYLVENHPINVGYIQDEDGFCNTYLTI